MPHLVLSSTPEAVAEAAEFVLDAARAEGLAGEVCERAALAASEAVSNAVYHGNGLDPSRKVTLWWLGPPEGPALIVEDEGRGVPAEKLASAALPPPEAPSGRGLYLLRALTSSIRAEGSRLVLRFDPPGP